MDNFGHFSASKWTGFELAGSPPNDPNWTILGPCKPKMENLGTRILAFSFASGDHKAAKVEGDTRDGFAGHMGRLKATAGTAQMRRLRLRSG